MMAKGLPEIYGFAKTGWLDPCFHRLLNRSFRARQSADYETEFDLGDSESAR